MTCGQLSIVISYESINLDQLALSTLFFSPALPNDPLKRRLSNFTAQSVHRQTDYPITSNSYNSLVILIKLSHSTPTLLTTEDALRS